MPSDSSISDVENQIDRWYLRNILSRTNWLYRVDALRSHDVHEINILRELCQLFQGYAMQLIIWAYSIRAVISGTTDNFYA